MYHASARDVTQRIQVFKRNKQLPAQSIPIVIYSGIAQFPLQRQILLFQKHFRRFVVLKQLETF